MTKKYLFVGMAAILGASLSFFACESATGDPGSAGLPGQNVGYLNESDVTDSDLAALFKAADIVTLGPSVDTVYGTVPAGKKLAVSGETKVPDSERLEIEGSVEVYEGAALNASAVSGTSGGILGAAGSVYGEGVVLLPYVTDPAYDAKGGLTYNNSAAANKAAGSVTDGTAPPAAALDAAGIAGIFAASGGPAALTVYGVTALTAAAVPANKTLTLTGAGNTFTAALDLTSKGNLVVAKGATLTTADAYTLTGDGTTANITINGTLALGTTGAVAGKVVNNGTITSAGTTAAIQKALISGPTGTGTVVLSGEGAGALDGATALTQNVEIASSGKLIAPAQTTPFSGGKTITVKTGGTLDFGAAAVTSVGAAIVNNGTITTAVTTSNGLGTLLDLVKAGSGYSAVTASVDITALAANFTVPAGINLTADSATFATGEFTVTVEAGAIASFEAATFAQATGITVAGKAVFGDEAVPAGTISVTGWLLLGNLTLVDELTIGTDGRVALTANKAITLGHADAKIAGATWEITPENAKTDGTVGAADTGDTAVGFSADGIAGLDTTNIADGKAPLLSDAKTDPETAQVLTFGTSDAALTVKGATYVLGVILDVSTKGKIVVQDGQKLTLGLGAGENHVASGGIFTVAIASSTVGGAVKANAVTPKSGGSGAIADAAGLGTAKVEKAAAGSVSENGHLGAGQNPGTTEPGAGVITGAATTGTTIDKKDTFAVGAGDAITATPVANE